MGTRCIYYIYFKPLALELSVIYLTQQTEYHLASYHSLASAQSRLNPCTL